MAAAAAAAAAADRPSLAPKSSYTFYRSSDPDPGFLVFRASGLTNQWRRPQWRPKASEIPCRVVARCLDITKPVRAPAPARV